MAESAKIVNPKKTVILPDTDAKCPMSAMVDAQSLVKLKKKYNFDIVSYVNTSAEVKAVSDICCTSANAVQVVRQMPDGVIFTPDENLGNYVNRYVNKKDMIIWPGFCPTHLGINLEDIMLLREQHPTAEVLVHPECSKEIIDKADRVASTEGMVHYAKSSGSNEFIIATEKELCYRMKKEMPDKKFYPIGNAVCPTMKKITLDKVITSLKELKPRIMLDNDIIQKAKKPLERMLEIKRD
jgi:quinolinate synthase